MSGLDRGEGLKVKPGESGMKYLPSVSCCAIVDLQGMEVSESVALQSDEAPSASDRSE